MKISEQIIERLKQHGRSFKANDNIADVVSDEELALLQQEVEGAVVQLLQALVIDTDNDHNTRETARRVAKMYCREVFHGRFNEAPTITEFPNAANLDEIYTLGPIQIRSACSHHFCPIIGQLWFGILPSEKVIGISKFARLADWMMSRPHIQEEAIVMLADKMEQLIKPRGLALIFKASHSCMTWRGVKEHDTTMVTSVMRGVFRDNASAKSEFLQIIAGQGYK